MNSLKDDVAPKVKQLFNKSQNFLSNLMNNFDFDLTKILHVIQENKKQIQTFFANKEQLNQLINKKLNDVDKIKEQIKNLRNNSQSKQLEELRGEVNSKLNQLITTQQRYLKIEEDIQEQQQIISTLSAEKIEVENERTRLKNNYEIVQSSLKNTNTKLVILENHLQQLKENEQLVDAKIHAQFVSEEDISKYKTELLALKREVENRQKEQIDLTQELSEFKEKRKHLETDLLKKVTQFSQLSSKFDLSIRALRQVENEKHSLKLKLNENSQNLARYHQEIQELEVQLIEIKQNENALCNERDQALEEIEYHKKQLEQNEEHYMNEIQENETLIEGLEIELLNKQNDLAISKAENGESYILTKAERKILDKEFEPRFRTLYKNCIFHRDFYNDFFCVTPSDRLHIEVAVVELNTHFEKMQHKIRPNTIRTKTKTILEYPFGTDNVGRVYFQHQNGKIELYRLSRTKNGRGKLTQDNVIAWLKMNL